MLGNNYQNTFFIKSFSNISKKNECVGVEIAFAGYSNSGKSSVINALTNQRKLARTSKTPGRTRLINLFKVSKNCNIVDLPGYGYAKANKKEILKWKKLVYKYFHYRKLLIGIVIVLDIRRLLKDIDKEVIFLFIKNNKRILILLNKSDKLSIKKQKLQLSLLNEQLSFFKKKHFIVQFFSALKNIGISQLRKTLDIWYFDVLK